MLHIRLSYILGIGLVLLSLVSCKEDDLSVSKNQTISLTLSNVIFENSDSIVLAAELNDPDGAILKVEILINDSIVATLHESPYQYSWYEKELITPGTYRIKAIAYDALDLAGSDEQQIEITDFREKYIGDFTFTSIYYSGQPPYHTPWDTITYSEGWIGIYEVSDTINFNSGDWANKSLQRRIKIHWQSNHTLTPSIGNSDQFQPPCGIWGCGRYHKVGTFTSPDTLEMEFYSSGNGGSAYTSIIGVRK